MADFFLLDDFIDFQLIGLNSSFESSFQFIYHLNQEFNTHFKRIKDLDVLVNNQDFFFSTFHWYDSFSKVDYYIIKNKPIETVYNKKEVDLSQLFQADFPLIQKYKGCNYILKVAECEDEIENLIIPFKTGNFINNIEIYDIRQIDDASRLIF